MVATLYSKEGWYWDDIFHTELPQPDGETVPSEFVLKPRLWSCMDISCHSWEKGNGNTSGIS